jgi:hypothetical protein
MNRAESLRGWAAIAFLFVAAVAGAQERTIDALGEAPQIAPPAAESPVAERSVLAGGIVGDAAEPTSEFCQCVVGANSPSAAKIEKALANPLRSAGLGFSETPLTQVAQVLEEEYGFPVRLDVSALDEIGIGPEEPVTFSMNGISLRSALRLMLQHLQLTYSIQNEVLFITTPEVAEQELRICVYDVREIVGPAKDQSVDELIDVVVACVSSDTWAENGGGEAEIRWLKPGFLVISQTQAVHEEVHALLATIRDVRRRPTKNSAETADSAAAAAADANRVTTRYYALKIGDSSNSEATRQQVRDLITESLPDERWKGKLGDGQSVVLSILPDRVVLRHKPSVQEKVAALLTDSGLSVRQAIARGRSGRGRGFEQGGLGGGGAGGFFQPQPVDGD